VVDAEEEVGFEADRSISSFRGNARPNILVRTVRSGSSIVSWEKVTQSVSACQITEEGSLTHEQSLKFSLDSFTFLLCALNPDVFRCERGFYPRS